MGYWNDAERTALRFRPAPQQPGGVMIPETAVWSGDTVKVETPGGTYNVKIIKVG